MLVIDESQYKIISVILAAEQEILVSMVDAKLFGTLNDIGKQARRRPTPPFGGIQVWLRYCQINITPKHNF